MIKKLIVFVIIILFIGSNFVSGLNIQFKNTTYPLITDRGNTLYVGGSGEGNYSKIQDAIDNASEGDTVFVFDDSSPYYENIIIDVSINLIGENKDSTIIDGNNKSNVVYISVNYVNVSNFSIQNSASEPYYSGLLITSPSNYCSIVNNKLLNNYVGILLGSSSYNVISNNIIKFNYAYGLRIQGSSNYNIIQNNIISNNDEGILFLGYSNYNQVLYNTIYDNNHDGIITIYTLKCNITGNEITNCNSYGIDIRKTFDTNLYNNTIQNSKYGGIDIIESSNISVKNNIISKSFSDEWNGNGIDLINSFNISISQNMIFENIEGLILINTTYSIISNNYIYNNNWNGIFFWPDNSKNNIIKENSVINNYYGIEINYNNDNNLIFLNNFINNFYNIRHDNSNNSWDNGVYGNYWDDYTGEDNNGDGIGDTPYPIPGGDNEDRYPLMEPYGDINIPPDTPIITGPYNGQPGVEYTYCINISDPDNDSLYVKWDWDDGSNSGWLGPYSSGEEVCASHTWNKRGTYIISVTVKDVYGAMVTAYMEVTILKNKAFNFNYNLLVWLFERYPNLFPILKKLLKD